MKIKIQPAHYVIAVSGGVDSMVLLDLLRLNPATKLTVAHFDHGIRDNSADDRNFVQAYAKRHHLPFVYDEGHLSKKASEAQARQARYNFLNRVKNVSGARAIVTAHHQDDLIETAIINLIRGTGRKGLSSLGNQATLLRPFLSVSKSEIIDYARRHNLDWREDSTNQQVNYLRNKLRLNLLPSLSIGQRSELLEIISRHRQINSEIENLIKPLLKPKLSRELFNSLPHAIAKEVMAAWLRQNQLGDFDRRGLERLSVAVKVASPKKLIDVLKGYTIEVDDQYLALIPPER